MEPSEFEPNAKKRKLADITPDPDNIGNGVEITVLPTSQQMAVDTPAASTTALGQPAVPNVLAAQPAPASHVIPPAAAAAAASAGATQTAEAQLEPMFPFRFKDNDSVEFIIPDEESYYSFAWIEVKILRKGVRRVGEYNLPYYVVSYGSEQSTVEEWQMRETSKETQGLANMRVRKGSFVEVQSAFMDSEEQSTTCWFMARVLEESQHKDANVKVEYKNTKWNVYGDQEKTVISKARLRLPPTTCLTQGLTKMAWGLNNAKLPIRLLSDEEHKIADMYTRFKELSATLTATPPSSPFDFESTREELNELVDSFNNARYYNYSLEAVSLILAIEKGMDKSRK